MFQILHMAWWPNTALYLRSICITGYSSVCLSSTTPREWDSPRVKQENPRLCFQQVWLLICQGLSRTIKEHLSFLVSINKYCSCRLWILASYHFFVSFSLTYILIYFALILMRMINNLLFFNRKMKNCSENIVICFFSDQCRPIFCARYYIKLI